MPPRRSYNFIRCPSDAAARGPSLGDCLDLDYVLIGLAAGAFLIRAPRPGIHVPSTLRRADIQQRSESRAVRNLDPAEEGSLPAPRQVAMGDRAACKVRRILKSARDIAAPDPIARESTKVGVKGHFQGYDCQLFAKYAAAVRFIGERGAWLN